MRTKRTISRVCRCCAGEFFVTPYVVEIGKGLYCSQSCHYGKQAQRVALNADGVTATVALHAADGSIRAHALIDASDADFAGQWPWHLSDSGYAVRGDRQDGKLRILRLHRELFGIAPGDHREVDHINRNKLDDRRSNLRVATRDEQMQNVPSKPGSSSQYRGVHWHRHRKKWVARIGVGGKSMYLGLFSSEAEAAEAARAARARLMPYAVD